MKISQLYLPNHRFHSPLVKTYCAMTSHIFHLPLQGVYLRPTFELSRQSRCGLYWSCSSGQKAAWVDKIFISKSWDLVPEAGVSINFKTWVFYKGWFPRFGFFISRPYAVFYIMKVVFFNKRVHILFISIIFEAKTVILPNAIMYQPNYWNILN